MNNPENHLEEEHIHPIEGKSAGDNGIEDVTDLLGVLKPVQERDPGAAAAGKQAFIEQARVIAVPVSPASETRHKGWNIFAQKERSPMTALARLALVLVIALGGTGATTYAAQASMPSDLLYPVKTFSEDFRLTLTTDPQAAFDLLLELAQKRVNEISAMADAGEQVSSRVNLRLQKHLQQALQQAAQLDDENMLKAMEQLQIMVKVQTRTMMQVQTRASDQASEAVRNAQQTMTQMENVVQGAMDDPTTFRQRQGESRSEEAPPAPENDPSQGPSGSNQKGQGNNNCKGQGCDVAIDCPAEMTEEECVTLRETCSVDMSQEGCSAFSESNDDRGNKHGQ